MAFLKVLKGESSPPALSSLPRTLSTYRLTRLHESAPSAQGAAPSGPGASLGLEPASLEASADCGLMHKSSRSLEPAGQALPQPHCIKPSRVAHCPANRAARFTLLVKPE